MTMGERAVRIARTWIGTPYLHQASVQGAGADCLGLIRGVWRGLYGAEPEPVPAYTPDWSEPDRDERLWRAALRHLRPCAVTQAYSPGEVLLFRMRDGAVAKHLGLIGCTGAGGAPVSFIHAFGGHGVIESPLSAPWVRRIAACFAFPELD